MRILTTCANFCSHCPQRSHPSRLWLLLDPSALFLSATNATVPGSLGRSGTTAYHTCISYNHISMSMYNSNNIWWFIMMLNNTLHIMWKWCTWTIYIQYFPILSALVYTTGLHYPKPGIEPVATHYNRQLLYAVMFTIKCVLIFLPIWVNPRWLKALNGDEFSHNLGLCEIFFYFSNSWHCWLAM